MKNSARRIIPIVILCIICIMLLSVFPRLLFHHQVMSLGDGFIDSETDLPYYSDMDCYYQLRMTRDIAEYGHPGETVKDGVPWDTLSYAPDGKSVSAYKPLMAYIAIGVNRVVSVFSPQSLAQTVYWLNVFLSALVVIPVFLLAFEMCGRTGAVAASVLSVLNLAYLSHTLPGFYDTDCVISWTSCFFFYFGIKLVKGWQKKNQKSMILNGIGLIVSFTALYLSWYVYYIFPAIFAGALILFMLLSRKKREKKSLFSFAPLLLSAGILILILILEKDLFSNIKFYFEQIFSKAESSSLFTNVFSSINEMQTSSLWGESLSDVFRLNVYSATNSSIINLIGGIIPFLSACAMFVILIIRIIRKKVRIEDLLLLLWFAVTLVLSFRGQRFIILFAIPSALLAGNLAGTVCRVMNQKKLALRNVYKGLMLVLLLFPAFLGVYGLYRYFCDVSSEEAMADRPVEECLLKIREQTPEDTMLVSWWDYGYFLEEKGKRGTLFDGGTQHTARTFFISRALVTENGTLSANIFRMLSGSGDAGFDLLFSTFGETEETVLLMDELLSGSKTQARETLEKKGLSKDQAREITELLFPEDVPLTEAVITPDMPWMVGWFPIFGRTIPEKDESSVRFTMDVHKMPISLSESERCVIDSGYGYYVILEKRESGWYACTSLTEEPSDTQPLCIERMITVDQDGCREYVQKNTPIEEDSGIDPERAALPWTVIVAGKGPEATLSLVSSALADSVFGKLVYLEGNGLKCYEAEPELSNEVLVYRITENPAAEQ